MKPSCLLVFPLVLGVTSALAASPVDLVDAYSAEAGRAQPGFSPSAARGQQFFLRRFAVSADMPSCSTCHTERPDQPGRHAVTGKHIAPLAPAANSERLTRADKVEKWFRRNCTEVVGRECTPGEKADFLAFLSRVGGGK